mmetsp:Transcript_28650/g.43811  ORF Transcript_28650/g.43811 Transcript_28650/m.43811 type:complete len:628 (+) Transcript_28650:64-1947(+)
MKLTLPSSIIVAMALYGTRATAFSTIARHQFGRNVVSTAAKSAAASFLSAGALLNPTPVSAARSFTTGFSALRMADVDSEAPFKTWTFDKSCDSMECNEVGSISISISYDASAVESDLIVLGIQGPEKEKEGDEKKDDDEDVPEPMLLGKAKELDEQFGGALTDLLSQNYKEFKHGAKASSTTPTLTIVANGGKAKKVILLGLGNEGEDVDDDFMAKLGSTLASQCDATKNIKTCSLVLPSSLSIDDMPVADMSTGFYSALYSDNRYRTGDKIKKMAETLESVSVVVEGELSDSAATATAIESGKAIAKGVFMSKDIVNAPHNVLNSESLANVARKIAEESGGTITCTILGKEECEKRGMGAYLGVARGSETQPQFIHLTYTPKSGNVSKKVGIVGKGLLFDTGGYNIKTAGMELMKFDCGGSAAVLGAAKAVGELAPEGVEAHFIVAACENMINDRAIVPSDVLTASNGVTIEIINTDAEGRLTLADALVYADKEVGCESIIELSTLTGACMVSLGTKVCGVWTSDDDLASDLSNVSKKTGEKSWRMPLEKEYNDQLKSKIADITNCGTRYGGAITAALFLENFVDKKKPFAHIDIAGPVWDDKVGATGFGAKMVTEWVSMQGKSE